MELNWPDVLETILGGENLSTAVAGDAMGEIMDGGVDPVLIAGFAVALRSKGVCASELAGLVTAMRGRAVEIDVFGDLLDTCGTGGDGAHTVNVSTMAAVVAAGAGARVAKHGGRAASSQCGSVDVLAELGVNVEATPATISRCIDEAGIGFLPAPVFHPAFKHVAAVRKTLGVRTVFNFLGPLSNPARASRQVLGVADPNMGRVMAEALHLLGSAHALVVAGADGLDEVSISGPSRIWELRDGVIEEFAIEVDDLGVTPSPVSALVGGDAAMNAAIFRQVLGGAAGPVREFAIANAGVALYAGDLAPSPRAGVEAAVESIDSGAAEAALELLIEVSNA